MPYMRRKVYVWMGNNALHFAPQEITLLECRTYFTAEITN